MEWRDAQQTEFASQVPQARIVALPGVSHYVFVVAPDTVYHIMHDFLATDRRASR